jgi:hypothetical protein
VKAKFAQWSALLIGGQPMHSRKGKVCHVNINDVKLHGATKIYPSGRHCNKCGNKLSIYNGMAQCNCCWAKDNFSVVDYAFGEQLEHILMGGAR